MVDSRKRCFQSKNTPRRSVVKGAAASAAAFAFGGGFPAMSGAQSTPVPSSYPLVLEQGPIKIYDYGLELPSDDVSYRWADHQGVRVPFHQALHAAFMEAYPNIEIQYDSLGADLAELLAIGVQGGGAHDVLPSGAGILTPQAVREGWITALDDIIPDFDQWKAAFPENTFMPGINVFNDKTYLMPLYSAKLHRKLMFHNTELLKEAGYDPAAKTLSWDEFRDAAKKVTDGGGYGLANAGGPGAQFVETLAELSGAHGGDFNWKTGEFNYTSDAYMSAIELMLAMNDDGSFLPGMGSMTDTDVRARFPQGQVGFYISGIWNVSIWEQSEPDFQFGVSSAPAQNPEDMYPISVVPGNGEGYMAYAESEYHTITAALFRFIGSLEGNIALKEISKAVNPVAFQEANEIVEHSENGTRALEINYDQLRFRPAPAIRNVDATLVDMERRPVTPNLNDIVNGIYSGQVDDPAAAMQDLQDRSNAELERAIQAARENGADVSRDDWVFPEWNPREDFGLEMYKDN